MVSNAKMIRKHPINYKKEIKCSRILKNVDIILWLQNTTIVFKENTINE